MGRRGGEAVCAVVLSRLDRAHGLGVACLAAPLATLTAAAGFLVVNTALGGSLSWQFIVTVTTAPLALGWLLYLICAPAVLIPPMPGRWHLAHQFLAAGLAAALGAVVVSALLLTSRDTIVGPVAALNPATPPASTGVTETQADGLRYLDSTAAAIVAAYAPAKRSMAAVGATLSTNQIAGARIIDAEVLPRLRTILHAAETVHPGTPQLVGINSACIAAFQGAISGWSLLAQGMQDDSPTLVAQANRRCCGLQAFRRGTQWQTGLLELTLGTGIPVTPASFGLSND